MPSFIAGEWSRKDNKKHPVEASAAEGPSSPKRAAATEQLGAV